MQALGALESQRAAGIHQRRAVAASHPRRALALPARRVGSSPTSGSSSRLVALKAIPGLEGFLVDVELAEVVEAGTAALIGLGAFLSTRFKVDKKTLEGSADGASGEQQQDIEAPAPPPPPPPPRENAVFVLGATGRLGRRIVKQLLAAGRTVIAGVRSADKARGVLLEEAGLREGYQQDGQQGGILFIEPGLDITNPETLKRPELWQGVSQVVLTVGTVFGPLPTGGFGVIDNMTSERVEAEGISALMQLLPKYLPKSSQRSSTLVLPMRSAEDIARWQRLDDVIMGGNSESGLQPLPEGSEVQGALWKGDLILEGGGFCGARTEKLDLDLSEHDGLHLRVKGDGQVFKLNIKTIDQEDTPESTYQATFDTVEGQWADVYLPWHNFVPVKRAQSDPEGAPLDPSRLSKFGLVLSRFEFNKMPNPAYKPGPFELLIDGGFHAYKDVKPQVLLISSAGVERNAIIGDDDVKRVQDIPIVQLNPAGTLNHKYTAEIAVRSSGYPYCVVRATGMIDSNEGGPFLLQADQGDCIVGQISRDEVAECMAMATSMPEAAYKTFELRRNEASESKGVRPMGQRDYIKTFTRLALDRNRWRTGLLPFPKAVPPPPPVTEERRKEILEQVALIRAQNGTPVAGPSDGANGSAARAQQAQPPAANGSANGSGNGAEAKVEVEEKQPVGARA